MALQIATCLSVGLSDCKYSKTRQKPSSWFLGKYFVGERKTERKRERERGGRRKQAQLHSFCLVFDFRQASQWVGLEMRGKPATGSNLAQESVLRGNTTTRISRIPAGSSSQHGPGQKLKVMGVSQWRIAVVLIIVGDPSTPTLTP